MILSDRPHIIIYEAPPICTYLPQISIPFSSTTDSLMARFCITLKLQYSSVSSSFHATYVQHFNQQFPLHLFPLSCPSLPCDCVPQTSSTPLGHHLCLPHVLLNSPPDAELFNTCLSVSTTILETIADSAALQKIFANLNRPE